MANAREAQVPLAEHRHDATSAPSRSRSRDLPSLHTSNEQCDGQTAPYSSKNEVLYFFSKGIPLGLSSVMNWGIPPLLSMIFAGHTPQSAHLQTSMGYGRVWYNCTCLMPAVGMYAYVNNVIPGCIGAGRQDRIPRYIQRAVVLSLLCMVPLYALQFLSGSIMHSLGVPESNAIEVGIYCRLMVLTSILAIFDGTLEIAFINLGYAKCATFNSLISGIGVDIACTYCFIYKWNMGIEGAALSQMAVKLCRVSIWMLLILYFRLWSIICCTSSSERVLNRKESRIFVALGTPQILSNFAGWLIFEMQLMVLANIAGIPADALAAGSIWVQFESSLAAAQDGWIRTTSMRTLALLGKRDPGSQAAYKLSCRLADVLVMVSNVLLLVFSGQLCDLVSNDAAVKAWLSQIMWVLAVHSQTRISSINATFLFIPLGRGILRTVSTFVSFYCIGAPVSSFVALTDIVTSDVGTKMMACVSGTSIANICLALYSSAYLRRMDWIKAGVVIEQRANNDLSDSNPRADLEHPAIEEGLRPAGFSIQPELAAEC